MKYLSGIYNLFVLKIKIDLKIYYKCNTVYIFNNKQRMTDLKI